MRVAQPPEAQQRGRGAVLAGQKGTDWAISPASALPCPPRSPAPAPPSSQHSYPCPALPPAPLPLPRPAAPLHPGAGVALRQHSLLHWLQAVSREAWDARGLMRGLTRAGVRNASVTSPSRDGRVLLQSELLRGRELLSG